MGQLRSNNKNVVHEENGNIVVINTCGFIDNAKQQSIDTILENVKKKNEGLIDKVFVTGCLSERYKPDLIILGHADSIKPDTLGELKDDYPNLKISQWFLDPLNKNGPDYEKNKNRILDKSDFIEANFLTTSPDALNFLPRNKQNYFIPNPADTSLETLENYKKDCNMDVFFALSHGVHRGVLKTGKFDDRERFINKLICLLVYLVESLE